jgi:hypothetical protein
MSDNKEGDDNEGGYNGHENDLVIRDGFPLL